MSIYAIRVIALLMDNPEGLKVNDIKMRTQGKDKAEAPFERMISDLIGLGCAYVVRYDDHIPVIKLQSKRFEHPNAPDTYNGIEAGGNPLRANGIRYRKISSITFEGKKLSAWAACQLSGVNYQILWRRVNKDKAFATNEEYQAEFERMLEAKRIDDLRGTVRQPPKRLDHKLPAPEPTTFSNVASVFKVAELSNRIGSIQVDPET